MVIDPERRRALTAAVRTGLRDMAACARTNPNIFCKYVLRDERSGERISQAPMHRRWHELIDSYPRLLLWSHVEAGKTNQISIGRVLYEIGRNPNIRVCIVSKTSNLAMKIVRAVGQYIERSEDLRDVFPHLRPNDDPSLPWTSHQLTIDRAILAKDPTVQATGVFGNVQGSRIDLLVMDDVLDHVNTRTPAPRISIWEWVRATLFSRLTADARVIVVGNAFHPDDLMHRLEREPRFSGFRFPVVSSTGEMTWPEIWPHKRIDEARQDMGPLEFSRALLCQARDDDTARFKREYIERALARGQGRRLVRTSVDLFSDLADEGVLEPEEVEAVRAAESARRLSLNATFGFGKVRIYTGVDLAVSAKDSADLTCLFTIAAFPNGDRRVLWIDSGRWGAPEILDRIKATYAVFGSYFVVENVAAQDYIVQLLRHDTAIPILPFTTGRQKAHPEFGVESLAAEFAGGKWIVPCGIDGKARDKEVDAWIGELTAYDPRAHTGDRLMAAWFAREGARTTDDFGGGGAGVGVQVFGDKDDDI